MDSLTLNSLVISMHSEPYILNFATWHKRPAPMRYQSISQDNVTSNRAVVFIFKHYTACKLYVIRYLLKLTQLYHLKVESHKSTRHILYCLPAIRTTRNYTLRAHSIGMTYFSTRYHNFNLTVAQPTWSLPPPKIQISLTLKYTNQLTQNYFT